MKPSILTFLLFSTLFATGCGNAKSETPRRSAKLSITETGSIYEQIVTVKHDNHWFVIWKGTGGGGLIHHPGCPTCAPTTP